MKRFLETLLVLASAPVWLPLAAGVALLVRAGGRTVLFRQERSGKNGVPFTMMKFRTMRDGPGRDGERTTRLGAFLRKTSLDELPQLFHVLTGKMALVGPRPLPVRYLPRYSAEQIRRLEVRPGITGWAQVNGRNALSWDKKFELDVWYVDHRSPALDLKILARTVGRVFARADINSSPDDTMSEFTGPAAARTGR